MANFNMQLHGDLVSLMEDCKLSGSKLRVTPKLKWGSMHGDDRITSVILATLEKHTVAGEVARAIACLLFRRGCKHGETRARAASGSPEI